MQSRSICVLDEYHPFFACVTPLFGHTLAVKEAVNVTVAVRFCLDEASRLIDCKFGSVVYESRHILLLHDVNLFSLHSKVVVFFEKRDCSIVSVV